MKLEQYFPSLLLTGAIVLLITTPIRGQEILSIKAQSQAASTDNTVSSTQRAALMTKVQPFVPIKKILRVSEIERPITSAQMLVQSPVPQTVPESSIVLITTVKANPTSKGVEVILQTSKGQVLQPVNRSAGNSFIADIPSSQLRLPSGEAFTFRSPKPIAGITEITVSPFGFVKSQKSLILMPIRSG